MSAVAQLDADSLLHRVAMLRAGRGDVEAQRDLVAYWRAAAASAQDIPDLETEALSYALMFARLAEANSGSLQDKGLLVNTLGALAEQRERLGDSESLSSAVADAIAVLDSASNIPGHDDLGEISGVMLAAVAEATPAEVEHAKAIRGLYDVVA